MTSINTISPIGKTAASAYSVPMMKNTWPPDTALRLARYFGTSPAMWMNLQQR